MMNRLYALQEWRRLFYVKNLLIEYRHDSSKIFYNFVINQLSYLSIIPSKKYTFRMLLNINLAKHLEKTLCRGKH